jgi:hypothetical protein
MARIFANALNNPEGNDDVAQAIFSGQDTDVIEIDGASNRGVDEAREVIANSVYRPLRGRVQDLHHRRGPHAHQGGVQRAPEDHGGAARARQVHPVHDRAAQGAADDPEPVPAVRLPQHPVDEIEDHLEAWSSRKG